MNNFKYFFQIESYFTNTKYYQMIEYQMKK